ncbi:flagellar hook-associated protein FlgK [Azospirillum picis]|uniref:Flagellar hook-associated protein 1 n=1 Tax=Azospirillum picis TaxID=488438 RepID=A0ABU0MGV5_9PROT|nr:flagellar hook-associated protein FlgK [Azospirillum picis]MBP2299073.1 flagellar hook-associated protein 1 FlgK [Azospirillum picis]MDQ0532685.1 flagellar hook-associated protein 1 FlgK [Azospirillum picis]
MSLFAALNSATAGLRTVQANVKLVSDNIAQANDPNRTRHTAQQSVDNSGQVISTTYRREVDTALLAQVQDLMSRDGGSETTATYMQQLGDMLRTTNGTPLLNDYADKFQAAVKTLATSPENETAQYQLVQAADNFSREIRRVSEGVEKLGRDMKQDLGSSVDKVNDLLKQINQINNDSVSLQSQGSAANSVADKRDGLIRELSTYLNVRQVDRPDGRVALFTPSGLALVDAKPATLSYDGGNINLQVGNQVTTIDNHLTSGKLGALLTMTKDGSTSEPPTAPSGDPTAEIIRKLRSQLDEFANAFTGATKPGEPTSFADAYDDASPAAAGEQANQFFTGNDRFSIAVNAKLLDSTAKVKGTAINGMVSALNSAGRSFNADGLAMKDTTYSAMGSAITGTWMAAAKTANNTRDSDKASMQLLTERYQSQTGVNIDEEIAQLQQLQTSYQASARVMQVANAMFDALEAVVR